MLRAILVSLLLVVGAAAFAATATVTLNGKTVTVPVIEANGKAYLDIVTLMKLLGGQATYTAAAHKITISTTPPQTGGKSNTASSGTPQLPGENGELNKIYIMGKGSPLHFSLLSAEYTTTPLVIGDTIYSPKADEKLLVITFTVQNPQKTEQFVRYDSLRFTVVDSMNVNHEYIDSWGDAENRNKVSLNLKPAQKLKMYTAFLVPAKGVIPKLMVLPTEEGAPILRYDLRDKVTGMKAPIADPSDPTGATALETVPAQVNTAYPYQNYQITVEKFSYTTEEIKDEAPEEGGRYLMTTVLIKNLSPIDTFTRWDSIKAVVTTTDGEELDYHDMLLATANRSYSQDLKAGQEIRVRLYFTVPEGSTPQTLSLQENESRTYTFEIKE